MFRKFRIAALSALLGLGTLAGMPAAAQADGFYFSFGNSGARMGVYDNDRGRHYRPRHHRARPALCTPRDAVRKAHRMGLRHARITRANNRIIRVSGSSRHQHRASIVFARAPHCPVIRTR